MLYKGSKEQQRWHIDILELLFKAYYDEYDRHSITINSTVIIARRVKNNCKTEVILERGKTWSEVYFKTTVEDLVEYLVQHH